MFKEMTHEEMMKVDGGSTNEDYQNAAKAVAGFLVISAIGTVSSPVSVPAGAAITGITYLATTEESNPSEPRDFDSNSLNSL